MSNAHTKKVSVDDIAAASIYDVLQWLNDELIKVIEQLAGKQDEPSRQLMVMYQHHLSMSQDFGTLLTETGQYLASKDATAQEVDEFLDIESKARVFALDIIKWAQLK